VLLWLQNFFWPVLVIFKEKATFSFICLRNARDELMNLSLLSKEMPSMGDHGINKGSLLTFSGWEGSNWNCHYLTIPWPHRMWYLGVLLLGLFPQWNLIGFFTVWMHSFCQLVVRGSSQRKSPSGLVFLCSNWLQVEGFFSDVVICFFSVPTITHVQQDCIFVYASWWK